MVYHLLADFVVVVHLGFVLFVVLGGVLVLRWRSAMWVHLPAAVWGVLIEFADWTCPLTLLENWLRDMGEEAGYRTDLSNTTSSRFSTRRALPAICRWPLVL